MKLVFHREKRSELSGFELQDSIHMAIAFGRLHCGTNSCGRFSDNLARIKPQKEKKRRPQ